MAAAVPCSGTGALPAARGAAFHTPHRTPRLARAGHSLACSRSPVPRPDGCGVAQAAGLAPRAAGARAGVSPAAKRSREPKLTGSSPGQMLTVGSSDWHRVARTASAEGGRLAGAECHTQGVPEALPASAPISLQHTATAGAQAGGAHRDSQLLTGGSVGTCSVCLLCHPPCSLCRIHGKRHCWGATGHLITTAPVSRGARAASPAPFQPHTNHRQPPELQAEGPRQGLCQGLCQAVPALQSTTARQAQAEGQPLPTASPTHPATGCSPWEASRQPRDILLLQGLLCPHLPHSLRHGAGCCCPQTPAHHTMAHHLYPPLRLCPGSHCRAQPCFSQHFFPHQLPFAWARLPHASAYPGHRAHPLPGSQ